MFEYPEASCTPHVGLSVHDKYLLQSLVERANRVLGREVPSPSPTISEIAAHNSSNKPSPVHSFPEEQVHVERLNVPRTRNGGPIPSQLIRNRDLVNQDDIEYSETNQNFTQTLYEQKSPSGQNVENGARIPAVASTNTSNHIRSVNEAIDMMATDKMAIRRRLQALEAKMNKNVRASVDPTSHESDAICDTASSNSSGAATVIITADSKSAKSKPFPGFAKKTPCYKRERSPEAVGDTVQQPQFDFAKTSKTKLQNPAQPTAILPESGINLFPKQFNLPPVQPTPIHPSCSNSAWLDIIDELDKNYDPYERFASRDFDTITLPKRSITLQLDSHDDEPATKRHNPVYDLVPEEVEYENEKRQRDKQGAQDAFDLTGDSSRSFTHSPVMMDFAERRKTFPAFATGSKAATSARPYSTISTSANPLHSPVIDNHITVTLHHISSLDSDGASSGATFMRGSPDFDVSDVEYGITYGGKDEREYEIVDL